ncbi:MAG: 6-carboxytetrahydropterin synthase [Phycisphaerales bacterium]
MSESPPPRSAGLSEEVRLCRVVRFWIDPHEGSTMPERSGFGGLPAPVGVPWSFEWEVCVRGRPEPGTGYLLGIQHLDGAVRRVVMPLLSQHLSIPGAAGRPRSSDRPPPPVPRRLAEAATRLADALPVPLERLSWRLTPFITLDLVPEETGMPQMLLLRQRFEFAAAHRLHDDRLDEAANLEMFGKCNNPNGHGHNYKVETAVAVPLEGGPTMQAIEAIVGREMIDRFDHRHLNLDCPEFASLNPSVEHIAAVGYGLLREPIAASGGTLHSVTVWETDKTCCTYPA